MSDEKAARQDYDETRALEEKISDLERKLERILLNDTHQESGNTEQNGSTAPKLGVNNDEELYVKLNVELEVLDSKLSLSYDRKLKAAEVSQAVDVRSAPMSAAARQEEIESLMVELAATINQLQEIKGTVETVHEELQNKLEQMCKRIPMEEIHGVDFPGHDLDGYPKDCENIETARNIARKEILETGLSSRFLAFCSKRKQIWLKSEAELNHPSVSSGVDDLNVTMFYCPQIPVNPEIDLTVSGTRIMSPESREITLS